MALLTAILIVLGALMASPAAAATFVYVGNAESNEIYVLQLDRQRGDLTVVEKVTITVRYAGARHAGVTEAKIAAIDDETSTLLTPPERAAIRFVEKLAVDHQKVDDALWSELRRHFTEAEIVELVAHATLYIGFGRFNEIIGIEPA